MTEPAGSEAVLRLATDSLAWQTTGDEVVALDFASSDYLATNPAATLLWPLLTSGTTLEALAAALVARWDLSPGRARADAEAFVADLQARGLLEPGHR